ncbi:IS3 family transposase [Streptomyces sp. NBC_01320]|uniref:IS3 family transposase n=1 Tax=Streptomyces sp. NBC_01320 TaxID=2903824 RepID=UPI002E0FF84A|nr:IS3 family transposase [Streptomyces sp. NBC_01320]
MTGDGHVRICGSPGAKSPRATRLRAAEDEVAARYRFIDAEKASEDNPGGYGVSLLCRALKVARSAYYVWLAARPAAEVRQAAEDELAGEIRQIHADSRGAYGAPRVTAKLRRGGRRINRKKVERIMRERDIRGITCRRTGSGAEVRTG